jgi:UTP--glucose-1-phosphate uridylyltransferase
MMTSDATYEPIKAALASQKLDDDLALFQQHLSLRLTTTGDLFRDEAGNVSIHPTGHGDLPDALRDSQLLKRFRERGGKYVLLTNLDNLGASVDPLVVGRHIDAHAVLTCEVVEKAGDKGGIPIKHHGKTIICEDFRLPIGFDAAQVNVFNTNTFFVNADALDEYREPWTYCEVEKKVGGKPAIQRERLVGELTFHLATRYVKVPRQGEGSRFLPVKDPEELARRRDNIERVARSRGMIE